MYGVGHHGLNNLVGSICESANYFAVNVNAFESRGYDSRYKVETWLRVSGEAGEHVLSPFALFLSNKCRVGCENLYCTILE